MATLASESLNSPGCHVPFLLDTILADLEGGRYVGPILPVSLLELINKTSGRGSGGGSGTTVNKRESSIP